MVRPAANIWKNNQRLGQLVTCRVLSSQPGGYQVSIQGDERPAFLSYEGALAVGQELLARVSKTDTGRGAILYPELTREDKKYGSASGPSATPAAPPPAANPIAKAPPLAKVRYRRVMDLVPTAGTARKIYLQTPGFDQFINLIENTNRTAIVSVSCDGRFSRSVLLAYQGKVVGCTYGRRYSPPPSNVSLKESVNFVVGDLQAATATCTIGDVPEAVVLSMAALYVGQSLDMPKGNARSLYDHVARYFIDKQLTGVIVLSSAQKESMGFVYVHKGVLVGYFDIASQSFERNDSRAILRLTADPGAELQASYLPDAANVQSIRLGGAARVAS